jgi:hypothetical protein
LQATTGILETVAAEVKLLRQLSLATREQAVIARKTKALSVLTNIEVARLGARGGRFEHLAQQLAEFSQTLSEDVQRLARDTDAHRAAIEEIRQALATALPRQRQTMASIVTELEKVAGVAEAGLIRLSRTPGEFRSCVDMLRQRISGVIAAVQAEDITRQQIEHVEEGLRIVCEGLLGSNGMDSECAEEASWACAGLTIQIYQLRKVKENVASWSSQIKTCMDGILNVSTSEIVGIGPMVLEKEREVSAQLAEIDMLEEESRAHTESIQETLGGLSSLMTLVRDHLRKSKSARDCLQLLTFNSIIEATHLGSQANSILALARHIETISAEWRQITDQAALAMKELMKVAEPTNQWIKDFSEDGSRSLHEAQAQTRVSLENLRSTANFAATQAQHMRTASEQMRLQTAGVKTAGDLLNACFNRFEGIESEVEQARVQLGSGYEKWEEEYNEFEVERRFSASYTTEMEREVLRAALSGRPLPVTEQTFAGNAVELF